MQADAEAELLERCRCGEEAAWDTLFDRHYDATARFIFQFSSSLSVDDVEEICQETFLTVVKNLGQFQGGCQFQTWLFRIASNKTHDFIQRSRAAKRGGGKTPLSLQAPNENGVLLDPPSTLPAPDVLLQTAEQWQLVGEALADLDEPCRQIIELRYFADLSYEEIAAALQLNPKTVSSRLSRCLDRLEETVRQKTGAEKATPFSV